tara:strand:- start:1889 stop:2590 length:702 start_codon:yes stop_codon:yes gene_type:complete
MNNYLHKISIILVFLSFISFILHDKSFICNIDLKEKFNQTEDDSIYEDKYCKKNKSIIHNITNENKVKIDKKFQTYGPTNYQDPNDMTQEQRLSFKYSYPNNMTLQDYVNWLILYKDEQKNLSKEHVINLQKLLIGEKLEYIAGILPPPTKTSPPLTSKDYFDNLYITNTFIKNPRIYNITNSSSGNMMAYNYGQYPDFKKNFDIYGTSGRYDLNPDLFKKKDLKNFQSFIAH